MSVHEFKPRSGSTGYRSKRSNTAPRPTNGLNRAHYEALDRQAVKTMPFQPYRLSLALDMHDLYDPELSEALGTPVGLVDRWEEGLEDPTPEHGARLVELTGHPLRWFWTTDRSAEMGWVSHIGQPDPMVSLGRSRWKIERDRPDAYRLMLGGES